MHYSAVASSVALSVSFYHSDLSSQHLPGKLLMFSTCTTHYTTLKNSKNGSLNISGYSINVSRSFF